jgi:hypothetical protein
MRVDRSFISLTFSLFAQRLESDDLLTKDGPDVLRHLQVCTEQRNDIPVEGG